jgi:hypothetical protein
VRQAQQKRQADELQALPPTMAAEREKDPKMWRVHAAL